MKKSGFGDFELIQDIIKEINFDAQAELKKNTDILEEIWKEAIGEKSARFSRVSGITKENSVIIACSDSAMANEFYFEKDKLLNIMNEKAAKLGIKIKDIKFNYKQWKEKNDE